MSEQKSRCPGCEPTAPNHVHQAGAADCPRAWPGRTPICPCGLDCGDILYQHVPPAPDPPANQEAAPAPPAAPGTAPRPQPAPQPGIDAAGFGPWPSDEEIRAHEGRGGRWLAKAGDDLWLGSFGGSKDGKRMFIAAGGACWRWQEDAAHWTFCPIDDNGDKLDAAPVLRGEDARRLVESLGEVAPPEEIARRRAEARERLAKGSRVELPARSKAETSSFLHVDECDCATLRLSEGDAKRLTEQAKDMLNLRPLAKADRYPQCDEYPMPYPKCPPGVAVAGFEEVSKAPEQIEYDRCPLCGHVRLSHGAIGCRHVKLTDGRQCDCKLSGYSVQKLGREIQVDGVKDEHTPLALGRKEAQRVLSSLPDRSPDRRTLVVLRGLPGSGKSTVAQAIVDSDPARWARVSKDDLRQMMVGPSGDLFQFVEDLQRKAIVGRTIRAAVSESLAAGLDVVVDATNLTEKALEVWVAEAARFAVFHKRTVAIAERAVPTPVEECVARDARRGARSVGRVVIERLAATIDVPLADRNREVGS